MTLNGRYHISFASSNTKKHRRLNAWTDAFCFYQRKKNINPQQTISMAMLPKSSRKTKPKKWQRKRNKRKEWSKLCCKSARCVHEFMYDAFSVYANNNEFLRLHINPEPVTQPTNDSNSSAQTKHYLCISCTKWIHFVCLRASICISVLFFYILLLLNGFFLFASPLLANAAFCISFRCCWCWCCFFCWCLILSSHKNIWFSCHPFIAFVSLSQFIFFFFFSAIFVLFFAFCILFSLRRFLFIFIFSFCFFLSPHDSYFFCGCFRYAARFSTVEWQIKF